MPTKKAIEKFDTKAALSEDELKYPNATILPPFEEAIAKAHTPSSIFATYTTDPVAQVTEPPDPLDNLPTDDWGGPIEGEFLITQSTQDLIDKVALMQATLKPTPKAKLATPAAAIKKTVRARIEPTTLSRKDYPVTPVLPMGTRFYEASGGIETFVIEQLPRKRVVITGGDEHPGFFAKKKPSVFSMPFVEFVIQVAQGSSAVAAASMRLFFRTAPLRSLDDPLFIAPLPNLARNGTICAGNMPNARLGTTAESIEELIATFWGSIFRYGGQAVFPGFPPYREGLFDPWGSHGDGADFAHWAKESKAHDSMWALAVEWEPSPASQGKELTTVKGRPLTIKEAMAARGITGIGGMG